jgi:pimeloyl-ACP methyl ester carboxylesterase
LILVRLTLAVAALEATALAQGGPSQSIEGNWLGTLETGSTKLRIGLKLAKSASGALSGTLDSIDQSANDLPLSGIEQRGAAVKFALTAASASYEGSLNADGSEMAGTWRQGGGSLPLVFRRVDKPLTLVRPQEPKKPYPYIEEEVSYDNKQGPSHLAGTLTLPHGPGPFPAVLLITGSGQQDRNEALMGHKPFFVLADYLTRKGIAVLRVDDRGMGGSTGDVINATTEDFAGDVQAGVEFLKGRKQIDARKIGLIGHSEGGVIAPMVAIRTHDVAFIVMMAGTGVTGDQVSLSQSEALLKAMGVSADTIAKRQVVQRQVMALVKDEADPKVRQTRLEALAAQLSARSPSSAAAMTNQFKMAASPWFHFFATYDPAPALSKLTCPVLALNGELDVQVIASLNLPAIVRALEAGVNKDYEIVKFPKLNHLFQTAKTGMPAEYSQIEETMAPVALETMADWILRHTYGMNGAPKQNGGSIVVVNP